MLIPKKVKHRKWSRFCITAKKLFTKSRILDIVAKSNIRTISGQNGD